MVGGIGLFGMGEVGRGLVWGGGSDAVESGWGGEARGIVWEEGFGGALSHSSSSFV